MLLLLVACLPELKRPDSARVESDSALQDRDRDGIFADADCDDLNASIHPGAPERCDGVDQDCDGEIDEDIVETWYMDGDGDGVGAEALDTCDPPEGAVAEGGDCDDAAADVFPGATETCDDRDEDCDGETDEEAADRVSVFTDADSDGWGAGDARLTCDPAEGEVERGGDCDDAAAAVNPAATEVCNGVDDDCDGEVDGAGSADLATFYRDGDGDGWGDPSASVAACEAPSGYCSASGDCDDGAAGTHPGAAELCGGGDEDCDAEVDEDSAADAATWYADTDGDTYGDATSTSISCTQPAGFVADATDCDDGDAASSPAGTELCGGGDEDCDGTVDEDSAADAATWYADADGDGYGDAGSSAVSCEAPSGTVADATDCDDGDKSAHPGGTEVCSGGDEDCDGSTNENDASDASTWYLDSDGDGYGTTSSVKACTRPSGYSTVSTDCNDASSSISPGATESCNATDDDCDSTIDDGASCPCTQKWSGSTAYLFCTSTATWTSASTACTTYGYHLVTVSSSTEDAWLDSTAYTVAGADVTWWGGYNDRTTEGTWVWASGSSTTTNWYSGEPNNSGNEDCLEFNRWGNWQWNDLGCSNTMRYICES